MAMVVVYNHKDDQKEAVVDSVGILKPNGDLEVFEGVEGPKLKFYRTVLMTLDEGVDIGAALKDRDDGNMAFLVRIHGDGDKKEMFVLTKKYIEGRHGRLMFENGAEWVSAGNGYSENLIKTSKLTIKIFKEEFSGERSRVADVRLLGHVVGKVGEEKGETEYRITKEIQFDGKKMVVVSGEIKVEDGVVKKVIDCEDRVLAQLVEKELEAERLNLVV